MTLVRFAERRYPSANSVLLLGERPVLVDSGFGSDTDEMIGWLGVAPALVVNTHFHSDHAGGNDALAQRFGMPIAASASEARQVNQGDPDACEAAWLHQPIEPYTVDRVLQDGDRIETGASVWTAIATPGHTEGHLSLHCAEAGVVVLGDAVHHADVGWLSCRRAEALEETAATLERLAGLGARVGYSGHGPAIADMGAALARARRRAEAWRRSPEAAGWHACKRIFAHALMLEDGMEAAAIEAAVPGWPWFGAYARAVFGCEPAALVAPVIREMLRADAAYWEGGVLRARAPHRAPPRSWLEAVGYGFRPHPRA